MGISSRQASKDSLAESSIRAATTINTDSVLENIKAMQKMAEENGGNLSTDQIFELFMTLFHSSSEEAMRSKMEEEAMAAEDKTVPELGQGEEGESREERLEGSEDVGMDDGQPLERGDSAASAESLEANSFNQIAVIGTAPSDSTAKLQEALHKLRQVDMILEQLGVFWANTEVVLDVLAKKGQHAEQFVAFAHKPKLFSRFKERLDEYSKFWMGVRDMCASYVSNVQPQADTKIRLYEFLEKESSKDTSFMSEQLYGNTFQKNSNKSSSSQNLYDADRTSNNDSGGSNRFDKVDSL